MSWLWRTAILLVLAFSAPGCGIDDLFDDSSASSTVSASPRPATVECFETFDAFKRKMRRPGDGYDWHHLVNQNSRNEARFGRSRLNCTDNVIPLERGIHNALSGFYNSKQSDSRGMRVREWQSQLDWNTQRGYGIRKVRDYGGTLPATWTR